MEMMVCLNRICSVWTCKFTNITALTGGGGGTRGRGLLKHCATSRKVAVSIPDGVTGIFHWQIFLSTLWPWGWLSFYQKWVPGIFSEGIGSRCVRLTTLPPLCADCLEIWGVSASWNPQGLSRPVMRMLYLYCTNGYIYWPSVHYLK
jgi:hypothetical protein